MCVFRGGKDRDGEMCYSPFRITPYLLKVQGLSGEEEPCCLALAERIISGYEGTFHLATFSNSSTVLYCHMTSMCYLFNYAGMKLGYSALLV